MPHYITAGTLKSQSAGDEYARATGGQTLRAAPGPTVLNCFRLIGRLIRSVLKIPAPGGKEAAHALSGAFDC
jgi:hypothetical protein